MRRRSIRATTAALTAVAALAPLATTLTACTADENGDAVTGIVPAPTTFETHDAPPFRLTAESRLVATGEGAAAVAETFAAQARAATGYALPVVDGEAAASDLAFVVAAGEAPDGVAGADEGYTLESGDEGVRLAASTAAGLFRGTQTLRQLLPVAIERADVTGEPDGGWTVPAASVADAPRFAYRGAMLDVARHFLPVDDVLRYIDAIAMLKLNVLHLHLTDDQGWRIQIDAWPELTRIGASTSVGGDGGGFYTKDDYRRIVGYAAERFVTVVPELDLPGHTNAALSAYPELNCDGVAPEPYEGVEVGFSSLCASPERAEATDRFLADVTREVAELTPGPWLHLGGDESLSTPQADYLDLVRRIAAAGAATGKTVIGWHEMGASPALPAGTIGQYWSFVEPEEDAVAATHSFVAQGGRVIMSPADVAYLDMKYVDDPQGPLGGTLGLDWAKGPTTLDEAYLWDPAAIVPGIGEDELLGVEAPLWTETIGTLGEAEFMAFPRITAIAEIGWTAAPASGSGSGAALLDTDAFFARVAGLGERWDAAGIRYYPVRGVPWRD
ncbi:hexosaminidase [Agromyces sp. 3263]|uniref:family 20 glycosylhydrolase n=1 Tax=Agromyces sp. 3263 TaxID=2817750 RepID=UPI002862368F|nr:family 20 glycosylhydrolase [Agromyces sp. 3263]MDR6906810.1 hexosaminidase [Agromyces sp. 3263]